MRKRFQEILTTSLIFYHRKKNKTGKTPFDLRRSFAPLNDPSLSHFNDSVSVKLLKMTNGIVLLLMQGIIKEEVLFLDLLQRLSRR